MKQVTKSEMFLTLIILTSFVFGVIGLITQVVGYIGLGLMLFCIPGAIIINMNISKAVENIIIKSLLITMFSLCGVSGRRLVQS